MSNKAVVLLIVLFIGIFSYASRRNTWYPQILEPESQVFLPNYSYVAYQWGEKDIPNLKPTLQVTDYGAIPNDEKDDTEAIQRAITDARNKKGTVVLRFPPGRFIVTQILFIERSNFVLQGSGSRENGTTLFMPNPLKQMILPDAFQKKEEYLIKNNKRVNGKLFSLFSWSGGILWTRLPENQTRNGGSTSIVNGKRGEHQLTLESAADIKPGEIVEIQWFNQEGKSSSLLQHIIGDDQVRIGERLYENPDRPLITQAVTVTAVNGKLLTIKEPLLHDLRPEWMPILSRSTYLENVGIEHFRLEFPTTEYGGHHLEDGYNAIYLTDLVHSWVRDLVVHNTDAAILSDRCKNVTIDGINVTGRTGHYSVHFGNSYGMLATHFQFDSAAIHDPSFNTGAKLCVFSHGKVRQGHLDQHCGLNHQNLFDDISVENGSQLFKHGGAGYWYPVAGLFNTFWNIRVERGQNVSCEDAPGARLIGIVGTESPINIEYSPHPYIEGINEKGIKVPSLYQHQLETRLAEQSPPVLRYFRGLLIKLRLLLH
jgi:hypothetical protein